MLFQDGRVKSIVKDQVRFLKDMSPGYILDFYERGPQDLFLRFRADGIEPVTDQDRTIIEKDGFVKERLTILRRVMEKLYKDDKIRDSINYINCVVPFCFSDHSEKPFVKVPALVFSKERYSNNVLIPSLDNLIGYRALTTVDKFDGPTSFKTPKMHFAGSLTNVYWNNKGIQHNQRLQVAKLAQDNPDIFDVRVMAPPVVNKEEWGRILKGVHDTFSLPYTGPHFYSSHYPVPLDYSLKYLFQLCVDGHTCAWSRLVWQMHSNCIPIKIRNPYSDFVEWFYYLMENGKHILEVDIESLIDVYLVLRNNNSYQSELANNSKEFAKTYLSADLGRKIFVETLIQITHEQLGLNY